MVSNEQNLKTGLKFKITLDNGKKQFHEISFDNENVEISKVILRFIG